MHRFVYKYTYMYNGCINKLKSRSVKKDSIYHNHVGLILGPQTGSSEHRRYVNVIHNID